MKKNILLSFLILFSIQVMAQEKGAYVSIWGGIGPSGFRYDMNGIDFATPQRDILVGGQAGLGFSYYFTKHIGITAGLGLSHYRTRATLKGDFLPEKFFTIGEYTDDDYPGHIKDYELRVRTRNWTEFQSGKFLEIPIMLNFQKKFGKEEHFGIYLGVGAKLQIPFTDRYAIEDGNNREDRRLMISGFYPEHGLELGGFGGDTLPQHGFSNIHNPSEVLTDGKGRLNLAFNVSLVGEAGFLISLSRRVDIALGVYMDYGLVDVNKKGDRKAMFTGPETDYVAGARNNPGYGITYNSILKSTYGANKNIVDRVNTISYGGKIGLRVKLGKLSERQQEQIIFPPCDKDTVYIIQTEHIPLDSILKEILNALRERPKPEAPENTDAYYDDLDGYIPDDIPTDDLEYLFTPIYFDLDQAVLRPESIRDLDKKVEILKKYPEIKLVIFGNTCDLGNDSHNYDLGKRRAEAAWNYLVSKGIDPKRLEHSTLSRFQPEKPNSNEPNRKHNRRDDFRPVIPKK